MVMELSLRDARRVALAAQGFAANRVAQPAEGRLVRLLDRLSLFQIDSVNVLTRAHYLPAFSRLGSYSRAELEEAAWGPRRQRRMFEYWAHEASLLPLSLHPLFRWRMERAERGEIGYQALRRFATEQRPQAQLVLDRIRSEGALTGCRLREWREQERVVGMEPHQARTRMAVLVRADHHGNAARKFRARL